MTPHELFIAGWIDIDSPDDPYDEFAPQIGGASTSGKRCVDRLRIGVFKNLPSTSTFRSLWSIVNGRIFLAVCCFSSLQTQCTASQYAVVALRIEILGYPALSQNNIINKNINQQTACETLVGCQESLSRSMWKELAKFLDGEHTFAGGGALCFVCAWYGT